MRRALAAVAVSSMTALAAPAAGQAMLASPAPIAPAQVVAASVLGTPPSLAASTTDREGRVYAAWNDGRGVVVYRWRVGKWNLVGRVAGTASGDEPSVAVDGADRLVVAWNRNGETFVRRVQPAGGATTRMLSTPAGDGAHDARLAWVPSLGFVALWADSRPDPGSTTDLDRFAFVHESHSADGVTWTAARTLAQQSFHDGDDAFTLVPVALGTPAARGGAFEVPLTWFNTFSSRSNVARIRYSAAGIVVDQPYLGGGFCATGSSAFLGASSFIAYLECTGASGWIQTSDGATLDGFDAPPILGTPAAASGPTAIRAFWTRSDGDRAALVSARRTMAGWKPTEIVSDRAASDAVGAVEGPGGSTFVAFPLTEVRGRAVMYAAIEGCRQTVREGHQIQTTPGAVVLNRTHVSHCGDQMGIRVDLSAAATVAIRVTGLTSGLQRTFTVTSATGGFATTTFRLPRAEEERVELRVAPPGGGAPATYLIPAA